MATTDKKWSWPKNRVSSFFDDIKRMTPKQKALLVVKSCRVLCDAVGLRFLSDLKVFWLSYCAGIMAVTYIILAIYTVAYYTHHNNFSHGIKATCVVGIAIPVRMFTDQLT